MTEAGGAGASGLLDDDALSTTAATEYRIGGRTVFGLSDGVFWLDELRDFIGPPEDPTAAYDSLVATHGRARLPIGCFVVLGTETILVDAGLGPFDFSAYGMLGGKLPGQLALRGVSPADIEILALTHLHPDHVGWLFGTDGTANFPKARIVLAPEDWDHFVEGDQPALVFAEHVRAGLLGLAEEGRVTLLGDGRQVAPGITRLAAPGHTPGHSAFVIADGGERLVLLGDAMYVGEQMAYPDWQASTDADLELAERTRVALLTDLGLHGGRAVGSHFPGLIAR
jgi:glyoxylase-like metal-dependent hydrolase (beta-lactamase superfamily II)